MSEFKLKVTLTAEQASELRELLGLVGVDKAMPDSAYYALAAWCDNNYAASSHAVTVFAEGMLGGIMEGYELECSAIHFEPKEG